MIVVVAFFLRAGIWGKVENDSFSTCTFVVVVVVVVKVEISLHALILLFRPGPVHSGSSNSGICG